jgi:hypothetical protein
LAARPGLRERVVLSTKFFGNLHPGDPNGGGAGRKALIAQLEESLRRLQTDYVDLYWLHNWDRRTPIEKTLRALDDLGMPAFEAVLSAPSDHLGVDAFVGTSELADVNAPSTSGQSSTPASG